MVFFTCNNCGESVKKPNVEKHYNQKCRYNHKNITCMDCLKDFHGEEYVAHTKCISELEKYSGKNYVHKESKNSGQKKQESWMDVVSSIIESTDYQLPAQTRNIFQRLQSFDNVPRKKAKFQNFLANCLRIPIKQAEPVWIVLEKELEKMKKEKQDQVAANKATIEENGDKQQNCIKRKLETNDSADLTIKKKKHDVNGETTVENKQIANEEGSETFQWSSVLEKIVVKHAEGLSLDKLKKKLLKKYKNKLNIEELSEKQQKKFEKKFSKTVKKCPAVQVEGEIAKPC